MTDHDQDLTARFETMNAIEPPDVWGRVMSGGPRESRNRQQARGLARIGFATAATAVIVGLIAGGFVWFGPDNRDLAVVAGQATCDAGRIAAALNEGGPAYDFEPSPSPEALATAVDQVVWGRITGARRADGRTTITAIADTNTFSIPSSAAPDGPVELGSPPVRFVAFLRVGDQGLLEPAPEGLWIACAPEDPALSVLVRPEAAGWPAAPRLADLLAAASAATVGTNDDASPGVSAPESTTPATALGPTDETDAGAELPLGGPLPPGAPDEVANRAPLPYCGATFLPPSAGLNPYTGIDLNNTADPCYRRRAAAALPAELIEIGSTGAPEGTLTLAIAYEVLDASAVAAIASFCDVAVGAAAGFTGIDESRLRGGLDTIAAASEFLPAEKREQLLEATTALRVRLDGFFGPEPSSSGFGTTEVIEVVNGLCSTSLPSTVVQA